jgi:hypothetical protein
MDNHEKNILWKPLHELKLKKRPYLLNLSSLKKLNNPVNYSSMFHSKLKDNWQCIPGHSVPVKRINNEVACLSNDGKTCLWGFCDDKQILIPLNARYVTCKDYTFSNLCSENNKILHLDVSTGSVNSKSKSNTKSNSKSNIRGYNSYIDGGIGLCQTINNTQPSWEQKTIHEDECAHICTKDRDCMGYSYSIDGKCQMYNTKSSVKSGALHTINYGDVLSKGNTNPSWKCKIKTPKVSFKKGPVVLKYKFLNPQIEF